MRNVTLVFKRNTNCRVPTRFLTAYGIVSTCNTQICNNQFKSRYGTQRLLMVDYYVCVCVYYGMCRLRCSVSVNIHICYCSWNECREHCSMIRGCCYSALNPLTTTPGRHCESRITAWSTTFTSVLVVLSEADSTMLSADRQEMKWPGDVSNNVDSWQIVASEL